MAARAHLTHAPTSHWWNFHCLMFIYLLQFGFGCHFTEIFPIWHWVERSLVSFNSQKRFVCDCAGEVWKHILEVRFTAAEVWVWVPVPYLLRDLQIFVRICSFFLCLQNKTISFSSHGTHFPGQLQKILFIRCKKLHTWCLPKNCVFTQTQTQPWHRNITITQNWDRY